MENEVIDDDDVPSVYVEERTGITPKMRFRALIRLVMANIPWLTDVEAKVGTKLYAMKKNMNTNLTLEHKTILNKDPSCRTDEENEAIYRIIGGFKCFRKYPEHVKMLLASYSHFCYFGPDRVIVRENHFATAIFFIISGEVNVIEEKHDAFLNETERFITETLSAGDVFGEICLLHNLPRMETIVSASAVEFLVLMRDDFDIVLKGTVKEEWDYISSLMESFEYFQDWDRVRVGECCMQSTINHYKKNETILGDGHGRKNYVHFVIDGSCSLIEHIRVMEKRLPSGRLHYELYNPLALNFLKPSASQKKMNRKSTVSIFTRLNSSDHQYKIRPSFELEDKNKRKSVRRKSSTLQQDEDTDISSSYSFVQVPENVKTVFMQVCVFGEKACFSLGEPMKNRRIVATEPVICLLIPAFLLLGRDIIWLRIKQFLTKRIPTTDVVFDQFIKQREWRKFKSELVKPFLNPYCTNRHANIPYTVRILNDFDYKPKSSDPTTRQEINLK